MNENTKKKSKKLKILIILGILLVLLGIAAWIAWLIISPRLPYYYDEKGIDQPDTVYTLTIEKQDFENEVALRLEDNGIIISATRFLGYLNENYPDFVWYNGVYTVSADMPYSELCEKLQNPEQRIEYVKFTVPEGKNIRGIAKIVADSGLCTAEEFIAAADSYDYDYSIMADLKARDQSKIGYKLEGFLFPATYEFRKDTVTPHEIVDQMLSAFCGYVTEDVVARAAEMGLDVNQLVSFASVIQAEAFTKESMEYISSVFWNRLNSSYKRFESDPTTTYSKSLSELPHYTKAMKEAYDTYKCTGAPVGPINCPGMDTINAVLNPADTNYLYFITDSENNFYYNETYAEHVADCYATGLWKKR